MGWDGMAGFCSPLLIFGLVFHHAHTPQVLADYHNVSASAQHVNDWSLAGVDGLPEDGILDLTKLGLEGLSMRVRVGRNLADFPLPGAMTKEV